MPVSCASAIRNSHSRTHTQAPKDVKVKGNPSADYGAPPSDVFDLQSATVALRNGDLRNQVALTSVCTYPSNYYCKQKYILGTRSTHCAAKIDMVCFGQGREGQRDWSPFAQPSEERISKGGRGVRAFKGSQGSRVGVGSDFSAYGTSSYELKFTENRRGNIVTNVYGWMYMQM